LVSRARIVSAADGANNRQIARRLGVSLDMVRRWRERWIALEAASLEDLPAEDRLTDAPRPGKPRARSPPSRSAGSSPCGPRITPGGFGAAADQPVDRQGDHRRGNRTPGHLQDDFGPPRGAAAQKGDLEPHLVRYRLTPPDESDDRFDAEVADIREVYREAPVALAARGERVVSTDEMTGVQAPEREQPNPPLAPGKVQRRELEYIPATGQPRSSSVGTW
jgi:hypothetical protein